MNKQNLAVLAALVLLSTSCKREKPVEPTPDNPPATDGTLKLELHFVKDTVHFHLNDTLTDGAGNRVRFSKLKFYLSHFHVSGGGQEATFHDAYLLVDASAPSNAFTLGATVPIGIHQANFTIGLDSATNHADPLLAAHPLNVPDMHWSWNPAAGYKFLNMEGHVDVDGNGSFDDAVDQAFTYHCATNAMRRDVHHLHIHADVTAGGTGVMHANVDVAKLVSGLDLLANPTAMGGGANNAIAMDSLAVSFEEMAH